MRIITLSREYGAGGHSIGRQVAKDLGIEFYDKDIISEVAIKMGIDPALVEKEGEELSRADSFFRSITPIAYDQKGVMFDTEKQVILDIARKGPCVILGRCADAILEEAGIETLNVFIYGDDIHRAARVAELIGTNNPTEIQKVMKKTDHDRHAYYSYFAGRKWADYKNYNLMLDSGILGYDTCIKLITEAARNS